MLLRGGQLVKELTCDPTLPLGMGTLATASSYEICEESLQPGDRLLLVTDGVDEARTEDGSFFGRDRLAEFAAKELASGLPTPEVMRRLQAAILRYQTGKLQDDATTVFVEWLTGKADRLTP
jgi:serine phosphatase RsbU (regulator of sigma subunit)